MKTMLKNKWTWIIGSVILMAVLLVVVLGARSNATTQEESASNVSQEVTAFRGDLAETFSASGRVVAARQADLALATAGTVEDVNVAVGDRVDASDVLVRLDTAALERAVAAAEQDLVIARADLAGLLSAPSAEDIAAAKAAVRNAQAKLDDLQAGPNAQEIAASEAGMQAAQANLEAAAADLRATYDVSEADIMAAEANLEAALEQQKEAHDFWVRLADCEPDGEGSYTCTPTDSDWMETATQNVQAANAQVALAQARLDELRNPDDGQVSAARAARDAAQARYDAAEARHAALLQGASDAEIAAAKADLASAQASLQRLLDGPSESDVSIYETRVTQAETALQEARNALADATLSAPFAGTVTAVHVNPAEKSAGLAVQLIDAGALEVVLEINEIDLGRLAVGQAATVTLETWPNSPIASTVTAIAPSATTGNDGIVSYEVRLHLSDSDLPVRVGMTANADLVTARRENVLLVPNAAVTTDREAGTHTVTRISTAPDGARTETEVSVTIGLRNGQYTEITGGLEEDDRVLVRQLRAPTQQRFGPGQGPFSD